MFIDKVTYNYSQAILNITNEAKTSEVFAAEVRELSKLFDELKERYNQHLFYDKIGQSALVKTLKKLNFSDLAVKLIAKLIIKQRLNILPQICACFQNLLEKQQGIHIAEVSSATSMTTSEIHKIADYLRSHFLHSFTIKNIVDPCLLGGLKIKFDSFLLDSSLVRKLNEATRCLLQQKNFYQHL